MEQGLVCRLFLNTNAKVTTLEGFSGSYLFIQSISIKSELDGKLTVDTVTDTSAIHFMDHFWKSIRSVIYVVIILSADA